MAFDPATAPWWTRATVYQVYPRSFGDASGYGVADYQGVDPLFGTLADLDALIAALHERRMKLVLDVVLNHT